MFFFRMCAISSLTQALKEERDMMSAEMGKLTTTLKAYEEEKHTRGTLSLVEEAALKEQVTGYLLSLTSACSTYGVFSCFSHFSISLSLYSTRSVSLE